MSPADNLLMFHPWSALAPGHVPATPVHGDVTFLFHAWLVYAAREVRAGRFPLWNPHEFAGAPFLGNPQSALLFPLHALAYVLPITTAVTLIAILKISVAGAGMYWFLRTLSLRLPAALLGAVAFAFSGMVIGWLEWSYASVTMLVPLLFTLAERLREPPRRGSMAALAAVVASSLFAGYPQAAFHALLATTAWALARAPLTRAPLAYLGRVATAVGLGIGLAAVQIVPFLEYLRWSSVFVSRAEWMPTMTVPLRSAITFLMPYYYGSPAGRDHWSALIFNDVTATVGIAPLILVPIALVAGWWRTGTAFFVGLACLTGAMVYGAPVIAPTLATVPPFSLAVNLRLFTLLTFALCVLAAIGLDVAIGASGRAAAALRTTVRIAFAGVAVSAFAFIVADYATVAHRALRVPLAAQYVASLLLLTLAALVVLRLVGSSMPSVPGVAALLGIQLASALPLALTHNPVIDARLFYPPPPSAIRYVQRETEGDHARVALGPARNMAMLYGLREIDGYDGMTPRRVEELAGPGSVGPIGNAALTVTAAPGSAIGGVLALRHLVVPPGGGSPAPGFSLEYDGADARVFRNERALPRAFLVTRARTCLDDATAVRLLREGTVDPRQEVLISGCGSPAVGPAPVGASEVRITVDTAESVTISAATDTPAYLVLLDTWFPGWSATVDGAGQPIWRADHAFRAVWLPPGRHDVRFAYRPLSFRWGLGVSALALALTALVVGWRRRGA